MTADPATTLAAHNLEWSNFRACFICDCLDDDLRATSAPPIEFKEKAKRFARQEFAAHVLSVLSATHAIIELPEAAGETEDGPYWEGERHYVRIEDGAIEVDVSLVDLPEARNLAAHILAATRRAESRT